MDEMNLLTVMRDEIPLAPPSSVAERLYHAGLPKNQESERMRARPARLRLRPGVAGANGRPRSRKLAVSGVLAAGLAAALVTALLLRGVGAPAGEPATDPSAGATISAQLLADIAGQAVLSQQPVKPDQWVYQKLETYSIPVGPPPAKAVEIETQWVMADGADVQWGPVDGHMIGGLALTGPSAKADERILAAAAAAYAELSSLPKDPATLEAYFARGACVRYGLPHVSARPTSSGGTLRFVLPPASAVPTLSPLTGQDCRSSEALQSYSTIQRLLSSGILPPDFTAELYHALADVPGVIAKKNVTDISGQAGVEFILPQSPYNENLGTILSAATYQYLGQASWYGHPPYVWEKSGQASGTYNEEVLLDQALVSGPGVLP